MRQSKQHNSLKIFEIDFDSIDAENFDLIENLSSLHIALSNVSQDENDRPKRLNKVSKQLVSKKLLQHCDKDIRLLTSCCIVDVLRIYAPDAPYDDEEMCLAFENIIYQLQNLSNYEENSVRGKRIIYILSSLAEIRSGIALIYLANSGHQNAEKLALSLFECLLSSLRPDQSEEIVSRVIAVLQYCMEEFQHISQAIIDTVLLPLLPASKAENTTAYTVCQTVLRRTIACTKDSIFKFINEVLMGHESPSTRTSELNDQ